MNYFVTYKKDAGIKHSLIREGQILSFADYVKMFTFMYIIPRVDKNIQPLDP